MKVSLKSYLSFLLGSDYWSQTLWYSPYVKSQKKKKKSNTRFLEQFSRGTKLYKSAIPYMRTELDRLRFNLPRQSVCQPIFSKMQGTFLLYTILWLVRPLIKNILDSSLQYLSNVTFGTGLAFHMREEYMFEKRRKKLDLKGLIIGVTQFHTQFMHVFRHSGT